MPEKLTDATLQAGGILAKRLTDMHLTDLAAEHRAWLDQMIARAHQLAEVQIQIYGFSSTSGAADYNRQLSRDRAWAVRDYINARSTWLAARITRFTSTGEDANAEFGRDPTREKDANDYHWRAVEVHLLGQLKTLPKPDVDPVPPHALPGASLQWAMGSGGSFSLTIPGTVVASVGIALFVFEKLDGERGKGLYLSAPVGAGLSLQGLIKLLQGKGASSDPMAAQLWGAIAKGLLTGFMKGSLFPGSLKKVRVQNAFRHKDLGSAGIAQGELGAGSGKLLSLSGKLPTFNDHGKIVHFTTKTFVEETSQAVPYVGTANPGKLELNKQGGIDFDLTLGKFTAGGLLRVAWLV